MPAAFMVASMRSMRSSWRTACVDQAVQRLRQRIVAVRRDAVGGEQVRAARRSTSFCTMWAGLPTAVAPAGTGLQQHGVRADLGVLAHGEAAQHLGAGADDDAALQGRMALGAAVQRGAAQGHALVDGAVVADDGGLADHHAEAVVDEDAPADGGARVDLDAGDDAREIGDEAAQPLQLARPARSAPSDA